ncbi:MAG: glycosyltransferase family 4 protein [Thermodesulfobacteriota bacterium]
MPNTLRIAVLAKSFTRTGGMERYVVETCQRLAARGHAIDVYAREADQELLQGGMRFLPVPLRWGFSSVLRAVAFARDATRMVAEEEYDIVHSHEMGCGRDIATVHTFSYRQGLERYRGIRWLDQRYLSLRSALYLWLEQRQMKTPWLVAVSDAIAGDICRHHGRSREVAVIPPGVDTEAFHPEVVARLRQQVREKEEIAAEEFVVLFVGSEFRRKGLDRLIPAIGPGMRLLVVGRGDGWQYHRQLVVRHGLGERVRFVGLASDVLRWYAAADVVVLPSRSEAFGMSILEGMACGLPVIASAEAGVAALIRHGENGCLMHEAAELPFLLERLQVPEERQRLGRAGRLTAEGHSWDAVATAHEELYQRAVAARS